MGRIERHESHADFLKILSDIVRVSLLDGAHGLQNGETDRAGLFPDFIQCLGVFLVLVITDALEEEQQEDDLFVVAGIDVPAELNRRTPKLFLDGLLVHDLFLLW